MLNNEQIEAILEEQDKHLVDESMVRALLSRVPPSWHIMHKEIDGAAFQRGNIQVIVSISEYEGEPWVHVSACGRKGPLGREFYLPTWEDMKRVKHDFIGPDRWSYQIFPPEKDYVNQNPYVLHLWSPFEDRRVLPDFTRGLKCI